jgi:hypothetical protein
MIRSSFPPQAATRSFYFAAVLSVIAFAITALLRLRRVPASEPGDTRSKMLPAISSWISTGTTEVSASGNSAIKEARCGISSWRQMVMSTSDPQKTGCFWTSPGQSSRRSAPDSRAAERQSEPALDDRRCGEGLFRITSRFGKCIVVPDASRDNGVYWQLWRPIEKYAEKSRLSLVADVPGGDRDRDHGRRDDDGEARSKAAHHQGYSFGVQDARAHLRRSYAR